MISREEMSTPAFRSLVCVTSGLWAQRIDSVKLGQEERAMQASGIMTHEPAIVSNPQQYQYVTPKS
jgi:hypothetical protein